jgi:hypothetical protein
MRVSPLAAAGAIACAIGAWAARADARPHKDKGHPPKDAKDVAPPTPAPTPDPDPATPASAPGDTYAVAAIDIAGDADPGLKPAIAAAVARGLDAAGAPHVTPEVVASAFRARPELVGCTSTTCLAKLGSIVGAARFVTARVETAGAAYNVELTVLTVDGPVARRTAKCEVCTMSDLGDLLAKKVQELITQPAAQPVAITLATQPSGGDVAVSAGDGAGSLRPVGKAPAQVSLPPGQYLVEVKLAGYSVLRKTITVADSGDPQAFQLALEPVAVETTAPAPRYHTWKWIAGGAAIVGIVTGAIVLSYDGKQTCGTPPCATQDATVPQGLVLVGAGVIAGAGAGWMFWHDAHEHSASAMVAPTPGGATAALTVRF